MIYPDPADWRLGVRLTTWPHKTPVKIYGWMPENKRMDTSCKGDE
jgi:hypothetical protein